MSSSRTRGVVAAVLAFLYPGLGHLYLREWLRALSWFGLAIATAAIVIPDAVVTAFDQRGLQGLYEASRSLPLRTVVPLFAVRLLNVLDAYLTGVGHAPFATPSGTESPADHPATCPECGKDLDDDLDFCPWCTTRLDGGDGDEESGADADGPVTSR
ncbi:MAG: zinc ribbon domain-containing protein [Halobacteriaceae archaeon]